MSHALEVVVSRLPLALLINCILGTLALFMGTVNKSGLLVGVGVGIFIYVFSGPKGFIILASFFFLGTALTRLGYRSKLREGIAQEEGGARGWRHALANCSVGGFFALLMALFPGQTLLKLAFTASFATALADTSSSEVGKAFGTRPILLTTLREVPRGTPGALSWQGTAMALAMAFFMAIEASLLGLIPRSAIAVVGLCAFVATLAESLVGGISGHKGLFGHETLNIFNTATGSLLCILMAWWLY